MITGKCIEARKKLLSCTSTQTAINIAPLVNSYQASVKATLTTKRGPYGVTVVSPRVVRLNSVRTKLLTEGLDHVGTHTSPHLGRVGDNVLRSYFVDKLQATKQDKHSRLYKVTLVVRQRRISSQAWKLGSLEVNEYCPGVVPGNRRRWTAVLGLSLQQSAVSLATTLHPPPLALQFKRYRQHRRTSWKTICWIVPRLSVGGHRV